MTKHTTASIAWRAGAAGMLPFAVMSAYLLLSRWPSRWFTASSDYLAGILSLASGSVFIATLPVSRQTRGLLLLFYIPGFLLLLLLYSLEFVGAAFGDWL